MFPIFMYGYVTLTFYLSFIQLYIYKPKYKNVLVI